MGTRTSTYRLPTSDTSNSSCTSSHSGACSLQGTSLHLSDQASHARVHLVRAAVRPVYAHAQVRLDGRLEIGCENVRGGRQVLLTVRDTGPGMTAEQLQRVGKPFYTTKKPGEGVGLGLAISSGIVTDLGGRLTARNAEEGGAVFEMQLPILGREQEAAE